MWLIQAKMCRSPGQPKPSRGSRASSVLLFDVPDGLREAAVEPRHAHGRRAVPVLPALPNGPLESWHHPKQPQQFGLAVAPLLKHRSEAAVLPNRQQTQRGDAEGGAECATHLELGGVGFVRRGEQVHDELDLLVRRHLHDERGRARHRAQRGHEGDQREPAPLLHVTTTTRSPQHVAYVHTALEDRILPSHQRLRDDVRLLFPLRAEVARVGPHDGRVFRRDLQSVHLGHEEPATELVRRVMHRHHHEGVAVRHVGLARVHEATRCFAAMLAIQCLHGAGELHSEQLRAVQNPLTAEVEGQVRGNGLTSLHRLHEGDDLLLVQVALDAAERVLAEPDRVCQERERRGSHGEGEELGIPLLHPNDVGGELKGVSRAGHCEVRVSMLRPRRSATLRFTRGIAFQRTPQSS